MTNNIYECLDWVRHQKNKAQQQYTLSPEESNQKLLSLYTDLESHLLAALTYYGLEGTLDRLLDTSDWGYTSSPLKDAMTALWEKREKKGD